MLSENAGANKRGCVFFRVFPYGKTTTADRECNPRAWREAIPLGPCGTCNRPPPSPVGGGLPRTSVARPPPPPSLTLPVQSLSPHILAVMYWPASSELILTQFVPVQVQASVRDCSRTYSVQDQTQTKTHTHTHLGGTRHKPDLAKVAKSLSRAPLSNPRSLLSPAA